jgi:signal transduction histidine kinase
MLKNISIRTKIVLIILAVSTITAIVFYTTSIVYLVVNAKKRMVEELSTQIMLIGEYSVVPMTFQDKEGASKILQKLQSFPNIAKAILYDEKGNVFSEYTNVAIDNFNKLSAIPEGKATYAGDFLYVRHKIKYDNKDYGEIVVIQSLKEFKQSTIRRILYTSPAFIGILIIAFLLSSYFQQIITFPIIRLSDAAKRISKENDFSIRLAKTSNDEIGQLYDYFNVMLIKIDFYINELEHKNNELEEFNYVASHDLREPLRTMTSYCELLEGDIKTELSADAKQDLMFLKDAAKRMNQLIQDLLDLSRTGRSEFKNDPVDMNACMEQVARDLYLRINETKGEVTWDRLPVVSGDFIHLCRVMQNLINNALKFHGEESPKIRISCEDLPGELNLKKCRIRIQDNGIGMDPKYFQQIFLPFKRLHTSGKYEGTGIGLAICKKIIERHNGKIEVESVPGQGSSFIITLIKHPI